MSHSDSDVPSGLPPGSIRLGGAVDSSTVSLRVNGTGVDPEAVSALLGVAPTSSRRCGDMFPSGLPSRIGSWCYSLSSADAGETDPDALIRLLLQALPSAPAVWEALAPHEPNVFCGLFLDAPNRECGLTPETMKLLVARRLPVFFDIHSTA